MFAGSGTFGIFWQILAVHTEITRSLYVVSMASARQSEARLRVERIDRSQNQMARAAGRQQESSAFSKPASVLPLIFLL